MLKKIIIGGVIAVLIICIIAGGALALMGYGLYRNALKEKSVQDMGQDIFATDGYVKLADMPQTYLDAVVAAEDHRFYRHSGIDILAICRAILHDIQAMSLVEGGSTITQQLAKNQFFSQEKEFTRKIAEVFMAWRIESAFTKDEILEMYVNTIYFGRGCHGIGQASQVYFGKTPDALDDYECTMLAGLPQAPSVYQNNPERAEQRRDRVVAMMLERGYLTNAEAAALA